MDLQTLIHHLEVGAGMRVFGRSMRIGLGILGALVLAAMDDLRAYRNMSTQEAMDSAQLARNISEGKGYTTLFVRPFSMFLIKQRAQAEQGKSELSLTADPACVKRMHPDIANPPVYPVVLAGLMKALPFNFAIPTKPKAFWNSGGKYQPDLIISFFNQVLFFGVVASVFFLARRLFDAPVAWVSAFLLLGTELMWRFSVSGLSTMLLLLIFMGLLWSLVSLEREGREPKLKTMGIFLLAGLAGVLAGIGGLTRYSFLWVIVPVFAFVILFSGKQRFALGLITLLAFSAVVTPWLVRNHSLSGLPFGTSTYTILEGTYAFPEDRLERAIRSELAPRGPAAHRIASAAWHAFWHKLVVHGRQIVQTDLPKLGGTWISAFFLVGLFIPFRNPAVGRLRYFLLATLVVFALVQAVGQTQLSQDSPDINSENLLVLAGPLILVYGVSLFQVLLEQMKLPFYELRHVVVAGFGLVACAPLLLTLLPPKTSPVAFPPYYPPIIQTSVGWAADEELIMSDVPWAVAWYGQSQCVWLTLNSHSEFFALNDYQKPVTALYLTPRTIENWSHTVGWSTIFLQSVTHLPGDATKYPVHVNLTVPSPSGATTAFPLSYLQPGWPMQLLLTYRQHWARSP